MLILFNFRAAEWGNIECLAKLAFVSLYFYNFKGIFYVPVLLSPMCLLERILILGHLQIGNRVARFFPH